MIDATLAYDFVDNIPWDKNPAFAFSNDAEAYHRAFRSVIEELPVKDLKISFHDDVWDFNPYFKTVNSPRLKLIFNRATNTLNEYSKFYVLHCLSNKKKISTANGQYSASTSILNSIMKNTYHKSIHVITTDDIIDEITERNLSSSGTHHLYVSIYQFYYFLKNNYKLDLPVDVDELKKQSKHYKKLEKQEIDKNKIPDIPGEYFDKILSAAVDVMRNDELEYNRRATACAIILLSQTGFRTGDLLGLTVDRLNYKNLPKSGNKAYFIHYESRKPTKAHSKMLEFDVFSNKLCTEAFETLKTLRTDCEFSKSTDILYILDGKPNSKDEFPVPNSRFNREYKKFLLKHLPNESSWEWAGIQPSKWPVYDNETKSMTSILLYPPDTRQYRVHLCTALYEHGVNLTVIQKYMGHLSEYMLGYYVRPKDTYQEDVKYAEKVIREMVSEDLTPLGGGTVGVEIKERLKKFIEDNNFNVYTDIEAIMKAIGDKVIIRGKEGGVCIKVSMLPCSQDARTNEMMCAYDVCPNLFHFYYMIDATYINFKTLQEAYKANLDRGLTRAAQKESNKIKDLIRRRLVPELDQLEKEINKKGDAEILEQHPTLTEIILAREEIRREAEEWMSNK